MRSFLLVGVSVFALGVAGAMAEETTVTDDSNGSLNTITQAATDTDAKITVNQSGEGVNAPGTMTLAPEGTNVLIDQMTDDDSMIDVTQAGVTTGSSVFVDQDAVGGASMVMTNQVGDANQAEITQMAADATINLSQMGDTNMASVTQTANENIANVDQWGNGNIATVTQGGVGNDADVDQGEDGAPMDMNTATVTQDGTESFVVVSQLGAMNTATAIQNMDVADGARITINQTGTSGNTMVTQN